MASVRFQSWLVDYGKSFSFVGLVVATLFFSASVAPSLLPRGLIFQSLLSGFAIAIGYGIGVGLLAIYHLFEIPEPADRIQQKLKPLTAVIVMGVFVAFLWRMTDWQNSIRELMGMEPLETAYPISTAVIAIFVGVGLVATGRGIGLACGSVSRKLQRFLPRRVAALLGVTIVGFAIFFVGNGVIARGLLNAADAIFLRADLLIDDDLARPTDPLACGSPESLVTWESVGRQGKAFLTGGPSAEDLHRFWDRDTDRPLRVYVGMRSAASRREQAKLALEELKRVGGFDRKLLIVATPTGTGWLDPGAVDSIEYLHRGDTAIVSMQYSYLPSWITILVDPQRSIESASYLFDEIYAHWRTLPRDDRPKLYLHGLSLGALGAERSAAWYSILEDPHHGAVFSGPPFPSRHWNAITEGRNPESPAWLPEFRDGAVVRFTSQTNNLKNGQRWGPMRNVYVQYASDPMVFFSPEMVHRRPSWLVGERGPDVSPYLTWYPVVTFLSIAFDLPMAISVPAGYGHNYAPAHYIDAWISVTDPEDWNAERTQELVERIEPGIP